MSNAYKEILEQVGEDKIRDIAIEVAKLSGLACKNAVDLVVKIFDMLYLDHQCKKLHSKLITAESIIRSTHDWLETERRKSARIDQAIKTLESYNV